MFFSIRRVEQRDIPAVAKIHEVSFPRQTSSHEWIACNLAAFPRFQCFVAENNSAGILGYVIWNQKSGFRQEVVLELEQIAVLPEFQRNGIGKSLITESLLEVERHLEQRGATIKSVMVSTRTDNAAQSLYRQVFDVVSAAVIRDLYSADEVILVGRPILECGN